MSWYDVDRETLVDEISRLEGRIRELEAALTEANEMISHHHAKYLQGLQGYGEGSLQYSNPKRGKGNG